MLARGGGSLIFTSTFAGHTSQSRRRSQGPPSISHRMHQASRPAPPYSPMGACRSPEPDHETQALKYVIWVVVASRRPLGDQSLPVWSP
jgi:hypothetical protein